MCTAGSYSVCAASSPKLCFRSRHRLLASTMLLVVRTERQHCACAAYRTASPQNIRCMYNDVKMQAYPGEMHAKRQFWASLPPEFVAEHMDSLRRGHGRDVNLCTGYACVTQRVRLPRLTCKFRRGQHDGSLTSRAYMRLAYRARIRLFLRSRTPDQPHTWGGSQFCLTWFHVCQPIQTHWSARVAHQWLIGTAVQYTWYWAMFSSQYPEKRTSVPQCILQCVFDNKTRKTSCLNM